MSRRKLTICTCTFKNLVGAGFEPKEIRGHHRLCRTNFNKLEEWKLAQKQQLK